MLRRTLTALTPALFALPFLLTPASQVYADGAHGGMGDVYSATECKVDIKASNHPDPMGIREHLQMDAPSGMMVGGAQYNTMYNRGGSTDAPNLKGITNTARSTDSWYGGDAVDEKLAIVVNCPLPVLDLTADSVVVTVVDGTAQGNVTCRLRACDGGVGVGGAGTTGACVDSLFGNMLPLGPLSSNAHNWKDDYSPIVPPGDQDDHVSDDVDFLTFNHKTARGTNEPMAVDTNVTPPAIITFADAVGMLGSSNSLAHPGLNPIDYSLVCSIPEQDVNQEMAEINTFGYSYIQSYAVNPPDDLNP